MPCSSQCNQRIDKRTGEIECFIHGTVSFARQVHDLTEPWYDLTDDVILKIAKEYPGTKGELARELGVSRATLYNVISRSRNG